MIEQALIVFVRTGFRLMFFISKCKLWIFVLIKFQQEIYSFSNHFTYFYTFNDGLLLRWLGFIWILKMFYGLIIIHYVNFCTESQNNIKTRTLVHKENTLKACFVCVCVWLADNMCIQYTKYIYCCARCLRVANVVCFLSNSTRGRQPQPQCPLKKIAPAQNAQDGTKEMIRTQ